MKKLIFSTLLLASIASIALPMHADLSQEEIATIALRESLDKNKLGSLHELPEFTNEFYKIIDAGADLNIQNSCGQTLLHILAEIGVSLEIIQSLVEKGAGINIEDNKGYTPAYIAAYAGNMKLVDYFSAKGNFDYVEDKVLTQIAAENQRKNRYAQKIQNKISFLPEKVSTKIASFLKTPAFYCTLFFNPLYNEFSQEN